MKRRRDEPRSPIAIVADIVAAAAATRRARAGSSRAVAASQLVSAAASFSALADAPRLEDTGKVDARWRMVDFGKQHLAYQRYRSLVPKRWNGLVKHWRRCLHEYDLPPPVPSSAAATVGDRAARAAPAAPDVERRAAAWDAVEKDEETPDAGDGEAAHAGVDGLALGMEPCTGVESAVVELGAMDATDDMLAWVSAELGWPDPPRDSRLAHPAAAGSGHSWGGGSGGWR